MSVTTGDQQGDAVTVAGRYLKRERALSAVVVAIVVSLYLATYFVASLVHAVVVVAVVVVVVRAPVLRPHGTIRLRSDADTDSVRAMFTGARPPVLALQWGIADEVRTDGGTTTYHVSYLFGLRSVAMTVHSQTETTGDGDRVELEISENGQPWGTYIAVISDDGDHTSVAVTYDAGRDFGLRRLPQVLVASRYRDRALDAQGFEVLERDSHLR